MGWLSLVRLLILIVVLWIARIIRKIATHYVIILSKVQPLGFLREECIDISLLLQSANVDDKNRVYISFNRQSSGRKTRIIISERTVVR